MTEVSLLVRRPIVMEVVCPGTPAEPSVLSCDICNTQFIYMIRQKLWHPKYVLPALSSL